MKLFLMDALLKYFFEDYLKVQEEENEILENHDRIMRSNLEM